MYCWVLGEEDERERERERERGRHFVSWNDFREAALLFDL
jgi:hypothetical protein